MPATPIDRRPLGGTGLSVSSLGMGCAKLGAFWQGRSTAAGLRALDEARDHGIDLFDTADCYARGLSERLVGRAFRRSRDKVVICTKVGMLKTPLAIASARRRSAGGRGELLAEIRGMGFDAESARCFSPSYVEKALERSLRRLGSDWVDVLLLHGPPVEEIRAQGFLPVLERLRDAGKARYFGISCTTEAEVQAALELPGVACLQVPHNLLRGELVPRVLPEARRRGVALLAMAPFGDGTLLHGPGSAGCDPDAVRRACLHFALATPGVAAVLVGMSTAGHVRDNVEAATSPALAPDVVDDVRRSISRAARPGC